MLQLFQSLHFVVMVSFLLLVLIVYISLYLKKKLSPLGYLLGGMVLIILALVTIVVLGLADSGARQRLDAEAYSAFERQYQIALYILPFISAAVGTNMISQAIIENKKVA